MTDVVAGAQAETVMRAIQSALVAAPAPQVRSTERRATLEDVAREPGHRMEFEFVRSNVRYWRKRTE